MSSSSGLSRLSALNWEVVGSISYRVMPKTTKMVPIVSQLGPQYVVSDQMQRESSRPLGSVELQPLPWKFICKWSEDRRYSTGNSARPRSGTM